MRIEPVSGIGAIRSAGCQISQQTPDPNIFKRSPIICKQTKAPLNANKIPSTREGAAQTVDFFA